jgi:hypothetical protein
MSEQVSQWLASQDVLNCIVTVDGKKYRVNRVLGIMEAREQDLGYLESNAPDWMVKLIREL